MCDARGVCVSRLGSLMVEGPRLRLPLRLVCVVALGVVPWLQWIHASFRPKDNWRSCTGLHASVQGWCEMTGSGGGEEGAQDPPLLCP
jgi:hypothetical protein